MCFLCPGTNGWDGYSFSTTNSINNKIRQYKAFHCATQTKRPFVPLMHRELLMGDLSIMASAKLIFVALNFFSSLFSIKINKWIKKNLF